MRVFAFAAVLCMVFAGRLSAGVPAVTTDQMREVDRIMVEELGISLVQMMENAGRSLAVVARDMLGGTVRGRRVLVLAGRGNNGGGGLAAARRLAVWGAQVSVVLSDAPERFAGVPQQQLRALQAMGVPVQASPVAKLPEADLILDALLGYGLDGPPRGEYATLIRQANASGVRILANDTPSGLDTTTGRPLEPAIRATVTLTLALPKTGLLQPGAARWVGELMVADISVPPSVYRRVGVDPGELFAHGDIERIEQR